MSRSSPRAADPSPIARERHDRAQRALGSLLLAALLLQIAHGVGRLVRDAAARHAQPAPVIVDIDRDPAWRLSLLPGLGPGRAWAIVLDRARPPRYRRLRDLERVSGIGRGTVEAIGRTRALRVRIGGRPVRWPDDADLPDPR